MTGAALQGLHTAVLGRRAIYLEETDSTNRYLKEAGESLPHGTLCYTGRRTSGRGRLGRDWTAPDGAALAMSVLLRGAADADWSGLPLVCGIAVAAALDRLAGERAGMPFRIKWPNDIICAGRKMCGILCESSQGETGRFAVAGIGVNLTQTEADFRGEGLPHAGSVRMLTGISSIPGGNGGGHPQRAGGSLGSLRPGGLRLSAGAVRGTVHHPGPGGAPPLPRRRLPHHRPRRRFGGGRRPDRGHRRRPVDLSVRGGVGAGSI